MYIIVEVLKQNNIDIIYGVVGIFVMDMVCYVQVEGICYIGFCYEQLVGYVVVVSGFFI